MEGQGDVRMYAFIRQGFWPLSRLAPSVLCDKLMHLNHTSYFMGLQGSIWWGRLKPAQWTSEI